MDTFVPLPSSAEALPATGRRPVIAVVVKGYPRLSETFIAQELLGLERRGLNLKIWSLRHPYDPTSHPVHAEIGASVAYLPEYLWREPLRVWRGWRRARNLPGYAAARRAFQRDLRRDPTPNRARRFGQACVLASELPSNVDGLYAHFLHTPSSVARYAAAMRQLPFAVSAHAKDIWTTPDWEIAEKIADAAWLTTCTKAGAARLREVTAPADRSKVRLAYHGLDLSRFPPPTGTRLQRDGTDPTNPVVIVSVGRLVEKKGYDDLLDALAALPGDVAWRLVHIGGGPLKNDLARRAETHGIADKIDWRGKQAQDSVLAALRAGDLFVLASRVADDGDRDGLPNVLMEAQSQSLACMATAVSGIPELIVDDETGLLVEARDVGAMTATLDRLIADPAERERLGRAGTARLHAKFSSERGIDAIASDLRESLCAATAAKEAR